jgi:uncharacterized protein
MMRGTRRFLATAVAFSLLAGALPLGSPGSVVAVSPNLVISQVYGGGGNSGATHTHDFIEIFNRGSAAASLNGLSLQYASATGTGNFGANSGQLTELPNVSVQPGHYYLVQQAAGAGAGDALPTPDLVDPTPIAMAAGAGKVALVTGTATLGCNGGSAPCGSDQLARIIDLVGYGNANFYEGNAAAPTLTSSTAAIRKNGGAQDTDDNAADFTAATPNPRNSQGETAPSVSSHSPTAGALGVAVNATITVTFSEPVNVTGAWFTISCTTSGGHTASVSGGPTIFQLTPDTPFGNQEDCTVTIVAANVTDQDTDDPPDAMASNYQWSFTTASADPCAGSYTPIYSIQGSGMSAAITGNVTTQGVIVGDFEGPASVGLQGFYLQDIEGDSDPATSDGIFVFTGNTNNNLSAGQVVRVSGFARERFDQTALNGSNSNTAAVTSIFDCGTTASVEPVDVEMPFTSTTYLERYEGMLVRFPQALVISEYFNFDRFGELVIGLPLEGESRHFTPTLLEEPGPDATARFNEYLLRRITLDDGLAGQNPSFTRHPNGEAFSLQNRFRGGDTVANVTGVLGYDFSLYRIQPTAPADYTSTNPRPAAPSDVGGRLKVAAFNTLNFFITPDIEPNTTPPHPNDNKCGPLNNQECRGWDSNQPNEFTRQRDKLLAALIGLNADVVGLNELENSTGVDPLTHPMGIVPGLNDHFGAGTYAAISTGTIGGDAIKVGLIYRPAKVTPVGSFQVLTSAVDPRFDETRSRPALAQTFMENATGEKFTVVVNHLKSKGSACGAGDDDPSPGGTGSCNLTRTRAAQALVDWLATDPTGSGDPDFLIIGDLNAYAMEAPISAVRAGSDDTFGTADDYTNLIAKYLGSYAYSYVFDGMAGYLDHALSNQSLTAQVTGAAEWHINADEPDLLDYDTSFKPPAQAAIYEANAFRSSDHDPVIVGLNLASNVGKVTGGGRFAGGSFDLSANFTTPTASTGTSSFALTGGLSFTSTGYSWIVRQGSSSTFAGTGTLNGNAGYGFAVSVADLNPGKSKSTTDLVRIKIWDATGAVVYDSQPGAPLTAAPTSPVSGNVTVR